MRPSALSRDAFVAAFGPVAERAPALAGAVWDARLGPEQDNVEGLHRAFVAQLHALPRAAQRDFLNAHPELGERGPMEADSVREQGAAGLSGLDAAGRARLAALNAEYCARHGIPFLLAVRGMTPAAILGAFEARLHNPPEAEHAEALRQVGQVMLLRLRERLPGA